MYSEAQAECVCCLEDAGSKRQSGDWAQLDSHWLICPSQACAGEGGGVRLEKGHTERQSLPPTSPAPGHVKVICDTEWSWEALRACLLFGHPGMQTLLWQPGDPLWHPLWQWMWPNFGVGMGLAGRLTRWWAGRDSMSIPSGGQGGLRASLG